MFGKVEQYPLSFVFLGLLGAEIAGAKKCPPPTPTPPGRVIPRLSPARVLSRFNRKARSVQRPRAYVLLAHVRTIITSQYSHYTRSAVDSAHGELTRRTADGVASTVRQRICDHSSGHRDLSGAEVVGLLRSARAELPALKTHLGNHPAASHAGV